MFKTPITFEKVYQHAVQLNKNWSENESVDWQEAEDFVAELRKMDLAPFPELNGIAEHIQYCDENDEWDSGVIANLPDVVISDLESVDKQYAYREKDDNWEVYSVMLTGEEDWVANVVTEAVAINLIEKGLSPQKGNR